MLRLFEEFVKKMRTGREPLLAFVRYALTNARGQAVYGHSLLQVPPKYSQPLLISSIFWRDRERASRRVMCPPQKDFFPATSPAEPKSSVDFENYFNFSSGMTGRRMCDG
jgi:hypothetical protein